MAGRNTGRGVYCCHRLEISTKHNPHDLRLITLQHRTLLLRIILILLVLVLVLLLTLLILFIRPIIQPRPDLFRCKLSRPVMSRQVLPHRQEAALWQFFDLAVRPPVPT
jgi:hypothetical protein